MAPWKCPCAILKTSTRNFVGQQTSRKNPVLLAVVLLDFTGSKGMGCLVDVRIQLEEGGQPFGTGVAIKS